jgi:hypothetical protein
MKKLAMLIAVVGLFVSARTGLAQAVDPILVTSLDNLTLDNTTAAPAPKPRTMRVSERFGRSMANIFSSPVEIPAQIYVRAKYQDDRTDNPFAVAGGLAEGVPMGLFVYFPWRLWAGLVDLCTLYSPDFDDAMIYPEYVTFKPDFLDKTNLPVDKNPKRGKK